MSSKEIITKEDVKELTNTENPSPENIKRPEVKGFNDPDNHKELIRNLSSCDTREKFMGLINDVFPAWLVEELPCYSTDYPHLQRNWEAICKMNNTSPQSIVIVQDVAFRGDDVHLFLAELCEFMTKKGYVVRRNGEMTGCRKCNRAIPCIHIWHLMNEKKMPVPREWRNNCSNC